MCVASRRLARRFPFAIFPPFPEETAGMRVLAGKTTSGAQVREQGKGQHGSASKVCHCSTRRKPPMLKLIRGRLAARDRKTRKHNGGWEGSLQVLTQEWTYRHNAGPETLLKHSCETHGHAVQCRAVASHEPSIAWKSWCFFPSRGKKKKKKKREIGKLIDEQQCKP
jgi:hypothetical protein